MIQLRPMTGAEFDVFLEQEIPGYAEDHVRAGNWHPSEALERSRKEFQQLLPDGVASKDQYLYSLNEQAPRVRRLS